MLSYKSFQAGMTPQLLTSIGQDVAIGITASGTTQATAYATDFGVNAFSTVASGSGARLSVNAVGGDSQLIYNGGANQLKVYPPSGAQINALGTNTPCFLAIRTACEFWCLSATQWTGNLSA